MVVYEIPSGCSDCRFRTESTWERDSTPNKCILFNVEVSDAHSGKISIDCPSYGKVVVMK